MNDRQERTEITIFKAFAKACSLQIKLESVKKMAPPKPDIQCEAVGTKIMAFELVEIIDRNFANLFGKQYNTKKKLSEYYSNLPQHRCLSSYLSHFFIIVLFKKKCISLSRFINICCFLRLSPGQFRVLRAQRIGFLFLASS